MLIQEALGTEVDLDGAHEADRVGGPAAVVVLEQLAAALGQGGAAAGGPFCGQDVRGNLGGGRPHEIRKNHPSSPMRQPELSPSSSRQYSGARSRTVATTALTSPVRSRRKPGASLGNGRSWSSRTRSTCRAV
ncbi:hypothetical protein ACIBO6_28710 [Streptomyces luteogriseus]|uniref:hypothetical protein n=1 Tax=Streptomyces luteogriseus TaxID=68233 RepID=UPI0037B27667